MKQKIVIKVQMTCDKCRTKAMKIAATSSVVISVGIQGPDKDQLVVTGEGVDSACLTVSLKKKLCYATILTVEEVKAEKPKPPQPPPPLPRPAIVYGQDYHGFPCTAESSTRIKIQIPTPPCDHHLD
ncbi:heavy metal-associated isoprenylated plant protein 47-like [Carya illinoinensis]|uniref:heavy metal-associated isoprenylated plant protein 47-like n=1 Tax=Carya illinoinensis TaxID=32201 RepID=UPI001C71B7A7|nr:heavy metal-associated isoprenylated plant protein 47-like [Carya illinoinensis]